jgi:thymidylate synthase ThyX
VTEPEAARRARLARYLTDPDGDVFALVGLPEVVKGAVFARYSRSPDSVKHLLLEEFGTDLEGDDPARADALYERVFGDYGDDSVAQLGGAHVALENVSNVATKRIEWGRLAAYLEQSTRYVAYDRPVAGRWRYHREADVMASRHAARYEEVLDHLFATYAAALPVMRDHVRARFPRDEGTSERAWQAATRAKALDLLRGLLPAATEANVGMFASGQSYELLLLRLAADPLPEARDLGARLLAQLQQVIPSFVSRVDRPDRGHVWRDHLARTREDTRALAARHVVGPPAPVAPVELVDWWPRDPLDAEVTLVVGALLPHTTVGERQLEAQVRGWPAEQRAEVLRAYVGERTNRRHRPGRALERVVYRFDVLGDYGGFRDLQRHRMCTIEWQELTVDHGYDTPAEVEEAGLGPAWHDAIARAVELHRDLRVDLPDAAQYVVPFAFRIRWTIQLNARAALQMLELRSQPQGHPQYRRIVQAMHRAIRDVAGHAAVADAMVHVDHGADDLERLRSERALDARRAARRAGPGTGGE